LEGTGIGNLKVYKLHYSASIINSILLLAFNANQTLELLYGLKTYNPFVTLTDTIWF
jgi:hypothetical protein